VGDHATKLLKTVPLLLAATLAAALHAQTTFLPLHVSPAGLILDSTGKPGALCGLNRSGTGSGNADATATDADYAAQNQLLSMNLVRIFVNATWWTSNVQVPIANQAHQTYIDTLIQRAKKYGNYVLLLEGGTVPRASVRASAMNCPASNQGDLDCQANATLCPTEDTTGNTIDEAIKFWSAFAQKYAAESSGPLRHMGRYARYYDRHLERRSEPVDRGHQDLQPAVAHLHGGHQHGLRIDCLRHAPGPGLVQHRLEFSAL
jgi:hypothetical protein